MSEKPCQENCRDLCKQLPGTNIDLKAHEQTWTRGGEFKGHLLLPNFLFSVLPVPTLSATVVRFASKKTGGSTKNRGGNRTGKRYGFKKLDGQFVHAGNILATQRVIRWHPGAHVGMGWNKWLYALEDGIVRFTKEVYVPPARGKESREVICRLPKGAVLYKTFINVVPTGEVGSFKLITMI